MENRDDLDGLFLYTINYSIIGDSQDTITDKTLPQWFAKQTWLSR